MWPTRPWRIRSPFNGNGPATLQSYAVSTRWEIMRLLRAGIGGPLHAEMAVAPFVFFLRSPRLVTFACANVNADERHHAPGNQGRSSRVSRA
jgi:hypothetical protein